MTVCALPYPLSPLLSTRCAIVIAEMEMKKFVLITWLLCASSLFAGNCVKNRRGQTVCSNGKTAVAVNPNTGNAAVAQKNSNGVTTTQTSNGATVKSTNGVAVAQGQNGAVAVNPHTGNAAVAQKNSNGVTTTQTSNGGTAKTKNGKGVAQGPGGTTCVKTANNQGCTK
jgi:hypothetical protein